MGAFTNPTPARPFAATALPDKPSALSQRLIREGCEKARSYRTLAQLLDEHREMLAALKGLSEHARPDNWAEIDDEFIEETERSRDAWLAAGLAEHDLVEAAKAQARAQAEAA